VFTCYVRGLTGFLPVPIYRLLPVLFLVLVLIFISGCTPIFSSQSLNSLAKSDTDMVADTGLHEMNRLMEELLAKLYKRNPRELHKIPGMTIEQRKEQIFNTQGRLIFKELNNLQGTAAMNLAFSSDYAGDRVFALMTGLVGMVRSTYNWQSEQFMLDSLDEQKLFDCARNIEVLVWRLSNTRDASGHLLLLTNSQEGEEQNLSYERLFGKLIAIQDMMAFTVAGKWDRRVNFVLHKAVFLPMGL
jgi:hypothetical protein